MVDFRDSHCKNPRLAQTPTWRLESEEISRMWLFNCSEYEFRTIKQEALVRIFCSPLFIIIHSTILDFLNEHVGDQFTSHPVTIYDRPTQRYFPGYHRLYIKEKIDDIRKGLPTASGKKIWEGSGFVFISLELKRAMEAASIQGVYYYPGLAFLG